MEVKRVLQMVRDLAEAQPDEEMGLDLIPLKKHIKDTAQALEEEGADAESLLALCLVKVLTTGYVEQKQVEEMEAMQEKGSFGYLMDLMGLKVPPKRPPVTT